MNKKIYKVTQTQLSSLQSNGFITVDGVRYDYDPNSLYILADPFAPEYRLETQGHNLHLLKDNVIISDLTVPFAQASVYASNAKNLQNKTGSKAYTYYDILPRVDYKDFLLIKDLPMEGILCGFVRNGYFYKVREEDTNTDIPFTLFCQTVDGYYSLSTSEITTPIEGYTIHSYFNEAKFIPYGSVKTVNNTEPDSDGNVTITIPLQIENIKDGTGNGSLNQVKDGTGTTFSIDDSSGNNKNPNAYALDNTIKGDIVFGGVGDYSTSLGGKSSAQGKRSVAQGTTTIAKGNYSHAEGDNSVALGPDSHAEGYATTTSGNASHSEGDNTVAQGNKSHAEGLFTKAIGEASHSEGKETSAESYASHTEGYKTRTTKEYAHAEGENTIASGQAAHAEGVYTVASGNASMAVGSYTKALGYGSFACGAATQAIGEYSFAQGYQTRASSPRQAVFGTLNSDNENALLIVGNGDGNGRKNVFTVNKDGTTTIAKDPVNDLDVATKGYVDRGIGVKQDKLSDSQQSAIDSGITKGSLDKINDDIIQLKYNTFDVHQGLDTSGSELRQYTYFNKDVELNGGLKLNGGLTKLYSYDSMGFSIQPFFETKKEDLNYFLGNYHTTGSRTDGYIFGWYKKPTSTGSTILDFSYIKVNADGTLSIDYAKDGNRIRCNFNNEIINIKNTYLSKNEAANNYVQKIGSTGEYKVYMSSPSGKDANRTIATAPIGSSVPIRTKEGHILLPDASVSMPAPNEAISAGVADDLYGLDRKTKDFHPTTTLRWLNNSDQREMVINGSWVGFYSGGNQLLILRGDTFTYLDKVVKWNDLADLVENGTVLLNGDTGSIGSYKSVGNGVSSALNFAGQNISNTAKGVNSLSLGRLNSVEGAACFAYGNKNIIKGVASIAFGGGNTAGEKIDWTSLDAATNSSSSYCFSIGENNTSIGRTSITIGTANNSKGDGSISIGRDNTIWSKESVAIGRNNYLNRVSTGSYEENEPDQGNGIVAIGIGLKTPLRHREVDYSNNLYWNCVISGRYNDPYAYNCVRSSDLVYASSLPPLFTLGNGLSDTSRNNAIVLFHNASAINSDFIYFNEYSIFNKKCEFRGSETIIEGTLKDASGTQYIKGGTITASFINSLF